MLPRSPCSLTEPAEELTHLRRIGAFVGTTRKLRSRLGPRTCTVADENALQLLGAYLRNGFGATTASAWSARARPGLGVSVPISWDELARVTCGAHWNVRNIHARLDKANEPWSDYAKAAVSLATAMRILDRSSVA
ncbi:non-homologous end-joining DNA ligase LigD [Variovorax sp. M-6]|uniref:non-homologous end-joining DNA ligase LigD n=1 Tax=Variovorax sp. M-6 TaxID=3233041 RepID=UPI003F9493D7